jgi:rhodanese-related sulfurtransferase
MTINAVAAVDAVEVAVGAAEHFAAKLRYELDPADLAALRGSGARPLVIDVRSLASWKQGRIAGAIHIPGDELESRAAAEIPRDADVIVYCWGPGCNGSTKAALLLSRLGYSVRELIGGFEYWVREGLQLEDESGRSRRPIDDLTAPLH